MDLTGWWAIVLGVVIVLGWYFRRPGERPAPAHGPPVPIQAGRTRNYQGSTQDNSSYTQGLRRRAIVGGSTRFGHKGSDNGSLERFFLTDVCVCPPRETCTYYDGGDEGVTDYIQYTDEGDGPVLDGNNFCE